MSSQRIVLSVALSLVLAVALFAFARPRLYEWSLDRQVDRVIKNGLARSDELREEGDVWGSIRASEYARTGRVPMSALDTVAANADATTYALLIGVGCGTAMLFKLLWSA